MPDGVDCGSETGIPMGCCTDLSQFSSMGVYDHLGPYDVNSIMHYGREYLSTGTVPTLIGVGSVVVPFTANGYPQKGDTERMCKLYADQCPIAFDCHSKGCPSTCVPGTPRCPPGIDCSGAIRPACCTGPFIDPCFAKWDQRAKAGCDFLKDDR